MGLSGDIFIILESLDIVFCFICF